MKLRVDLGAPPRSSLAVSQGCARVARRERIRQRERRLYAVALALIAGLVTAAIACAL